MEKQKIRSYYAVGVVILLLLMVARFIFEPQILGPGIKIFLRIFSFLFWAIAIAYFLNPIMMWLERRVLMLKKEKRLLSMLIVYILFLGVMTFFGAVVLPIVISNVIKLINSAPDYIEQTDAWLREILHTPWMEDIGAPDVVYGWLSDLNAYIMENLDDWAIAVARGAVGLGRGLIQFIFGTVLSIYMLRDRERMIRGMKRLNYALFKPRKAKWIACAAERVNRIFKKYILGKIFDSTAVGIISYVAFLCIGAPLALLQAVILMLSNMIPTIGPLIGAIPCILLTLLVDPIKALWVLIFIIVIQQLDGLFLDPKIMGNTLKISPFYIIAGVLIGGGFFGILGMFLGVPVLAAIKAFLDEYVDKRLNEQGIELSK